MTSEGAPDLSYPSSSTIVGPSSLNMSLPHTDSSHRIGITLLGSLAGQIIMGGRAMACPDRGRIKAGCSDPRRSRWPGISFAYAVLFLAMLLFREECHAAALSRPPVKSSPLIGVGYHQHAESLPIWQAITRGMPGYIYAGATKHDAGRRRGREAPTLATHERGGSKESRGMPIIPGDRTTVCER